MKFVNKKIFSLCLVLCMVVAPLNVTAAAAEIPESGRLDTETEVSIGTPIYACPAEDAEEIMLDDIDAIAAVAGYASVEAPENASRKYTRNNEGIIGAAPIRKLPRAGGKNDKLFDWDSVATATLSFSCDSAWLCSRPGIPVPVPPGRGLPKDQ